jgi:hypothetical protein
MIDIFKAPPINFNRLLKSVNIAIEKNSLDKNSAEWKKVFLEIDMVESQDRTGFRMKDTDVPK